MKASHSYPWISKCYTLWYSVAAAAGIVLILLFGGTAPTNDELFQQLARGSVILVIVMFAQYLITERQAKYWPLSISPAGLIFHAQSADHDVKWSAIDCVEIFPAPDKKTPVEWSQALFSRGIIAHTKKW